LTTGAGVDAALLATTALNGFTDVAPNVLLPPNVLAPPKALAPPNKEVAGALVVVELIEADVPNAGAAALAPNMDPPNIGVAGTGVAVAVKAGAIVVDVKAGAIVVAVKAGAIVAAGIGTVVIVAPPKSDVGGFSALAFEEPPKRFVDVLLRALKRPESK
jgi:hypothetical protein